MNKSTNPNDLKYVKDILFIIRKQADSLIREIEDNKVTRHELVERMESQLLYISAIDFENALLAQRPGLA